MMTMMMMQRLLQSEGGTANSSTKDTEASTEQRSSFESLPYQFANRDKEISEIGEHNQLFIKTFSNNNLNQHIINNNFKDNFIKFERNEIRKPFFECDPSKVGRAFQEYKSKHKTEVEENANNVDKYEKAHQLEESAARRLSCDSEDSFNEAVHNHVMVSEERVSSEEEFSNMTREEDVRSPVDLTSRRLLEANSSDRQSSGSGTEDSTLDETCKNDKVSSEIPPRTLSFSVENILDPNKFTGKQFEESLKDKIVQSYNWKPHLDFMDASPVNASRTGRVMLDFL